MINCIIVDDEDHALEVIQTYSKKIPYLEVWGAFNDPKDAIAYIDAHHGEIDLVFLDIEMPHFSGIDFLKAYSFPNVIMVTAYSNFAVDSYQYGVIDYLLKPFSFDRFSMAVAKVYERHQSHGGTNKRNIDNEIDAVYLKADRRKHMQVELQNIQYIKGAANFSVVFMRNNDEIIVSDRLNKLAEKLPLKRFLRIHRSFIINMDHVEYVDGSKVKLKGIDNHFTIGPAYVHGIQEHIQ